MVYSILLKLMNAQVLAIAIITCHMKDLQISSILCGIVVLFMFPL